MKNKNTKPDKSILNMVDSLDKIKYDYVVKMKPKSYKIKAHIKNIYNEKWSWKMEYCKKHRLPAAKSWAWNKAEKAYKEYRRKQNDSTRSN